MEDGKWKMLNVAKLGLCRLNCWIVILFKFLLDC